MPGWIVIKVIRHINNLDMLLWEPNKIRQNQMSLSLITGCSVYDNNLCNTVEIL